MSLETNSITKINVSGAGNIQIPKYTYEVEITATGGGGGGGEAHAGGKGANNGGGGASGSLIIKTLSISGKELISYYVGEGGDASSGGDGSKGNDASFTYDGIEYKAKGGGAGGDADASANGDVGTAVAVVDGDTNTIGDDGGSGSGLGFNSYPGGSSVSSDGYGAGGDGSTSTISQNNEPGGDGGIVFNFKIRTPTTTVPSGRTEVIKEARIGGNRISLTEDSLTGKSRMQASMANGSISLEDTDTKLTIGGMPLTLKQTSNGNYVIHVYIIDDDTEIYTPDTFEQSTDTTMFRGIDIDTFVANDGKRVFVFDRLEDQEVVSGFGKLNSNDSIKNTVMWLGTPIAVNNDDVFVVSVSDNPNVDEFVTTYFMGFPFLVARQGSDYLLCALFDDYEYESEVTGLNYN